MRTYCFLCFLLLSSVALTAQRNYRVTPDPDVARVLDVFAEVSEREDKVEGWRVQILATTDRRQLETTETAFRANYPSVPVDWVHNTPYYKLRAGAFYTRQEADQLRQTLSKEFESVYLVKDEVSEAELLKMY
ncbi:SPOR domain-containing protein [Lewinella sp. JB7]|uniref:SPOR domain-containing protein n=1 Tax=Lewinella sp. JB7 TaxID=2962887 RepID=UPI0020C96EB8|nr:SPOR domain-containing protein [Lewinella sp. JB7]MCP9237664.1 SPOR domain-containing protein [Lewinella sp. JB7]